MGRYTHPNPLTLAQARGIVRRHGIAEGTLEWQKAFRAAYEKAAAPGSNGLESYLEKLDDDIAWFAGRARIDSRK